MVSRSELLRHDVSIYDSYRDTICSKTCDGRNWCVIVFALQQEHSAYRTKAFLNQTVEVLIEKTSKKSDDHWAGRTSQNSMTVFPKAHYKVGDLVNVKVTDCTSATLIGEAIGYSKNN